MQPMMLVMVVHPRYVDQLPEGITGFNQLALGRSWLKLREYFVTKCAELEKAQKNHGIKLLALHRIIPKSHTTCLRVLSKHFLKSARLDAVPTSLGSLSTAQPPSGGRTFF